MLYAPANQEASALLSTTLPELKSVVMEYSGDTRKLHMVTASDIVTLNRGQAVPDCISSVTPSILYQPSPFLCNWAFFMINGYLMPRALH